MTDPEDHFEAEDIRELGQMGRMMDDDVEPDLPEPGEKMERFLDYCEHEYGDDQLPF
jgi:hypothetical protein